MKISFAGPEDLKAVSRQRHLYSSKRENGRTLIIGGSDRFHGAPVLASNAAYLTLAALRTGIGYAVTCVPKSIVIPVRALSPNIIVRPLTGKNINLRDVSILEKQAKISDSIVVGPGLGREEKSLRAVARLLSYCMTLGKRTVVDADAIYSVCLLRKRMNRNVLLTPNDNEFLQLNKIRLDKTGIIKRARAAADAAKQLNANVLLKGHKTIVTDGKRIKIINAKTSALATMGTGDVLSGIISGYMARNSDVFKSAVAGAYLHAIIGDQLFKEKGYHITAQDVVECIPRILKEFDG